MSNPATPIVEIPEKPLSMMDLDKGKKSHSLTDLMPSSQKIGTGRKKGPYYRVESKVKEYIDSLPPPNSRKKSFKKHASMPSYLGGNQLEQDFSEYKRISEFTISELEKQVQVAVTLISQANEENFQLLDRIERMEQQMPAQASASLIPSEVKDIANDMIPSDNEQVTSHNPTNETVVTDGALRAKRNLSFNSSSDLTQSGGATDSGINTSDGIAETVDQILLTDPDTVVEKSRGRNWKRRHIWQYIVPCINCPSSKNNSQSESNAFYKNF